MPQDNTLGAPTEGLGQTVTFAARGGGGQSQAQGSQRQGMRNNSTGGGAQLTARALQIPQAEPDGTMQALMKLGGEIIRPRLEQERTAAYVQGMQKAAQGQAITEIVDEQPWYSQLFGSTSLVDGARAYTASAKASSVAAGMEADMENLRKMSADEFGNYATQTITKNQTGDPTTDMMLAQQISATLPAVMKGQAKAHLRYQQEVFEGSIKSAQTAAFANLGTVGAESRKPGATKEEADVLGAAINTLGVLEVPAGMKPELHDKLLAESAIQAVSGGNFDTYTLLKDSGKLAKMEPTAAYHVERAYSQASNQAKLNVPNQLLDKVANFRTLARRPGMSDENIHAAADAINDEYKQMTGDPGAFISKANTIQELQQLREYQDAQQAALNRARSTAVSKADKEVAEIAAISNLASRVVAGDGTRPYLLSAETDKERQEVFQHLRATATPEIRNRVMVEQVDVAIDKVAKGNIESAIGTAKTAGDPSLLYEVYRTQYLPLVQAAGDNAEYVAQKYAGAYGEDMARYHALAQGREVTPAYQGAFYNEVVSPRAKPLTVTKKNKEIVDELTTGTFMSFMPFTGEPIRDPEGYAAELAPKMKPYLGTKDAIKDAKLALPNLNLVGGYHWKKNVKDTDLTEWIAKNKVVGGVAPDHLGDALSIVVKQYSKEAGIEGTVQLGQTADTVGGEPRMYIMGTGSDGKARILPFPASDMHKVWKAGSGRLTKDDLAFGPKLTNVVPDDMPSIYAGPEEWAAYRKRQADRKVAK